ncbi:hypothetical protein L798_07935 [Zootermopsis nevadensis]|uniref:DUF4817 domain-containing protein n=1 Tax=Zootermopsis nevadensis TaxID=136037 RepID=A0A067RJF1_ZOONE|nr:hypothetical protein L798_07935 [Zootermopsis nevadensis]
MSFSQAERVFIMEHYIKTNSYTECQQSFVRSFPESRVPHKSTICRIAYRFRETGSVSDKKRSGRPSSLSDENLNDVKQYSEWSPRKSLTRLAQQTGLSYGTTQRCTRRLKLVPYRIHTMHELKEPDKGKRLQYCEWFRELVRDGVGILDNIFFTDEAWFHLSGYVNSQNSRFWSSDNPQVFHEVPLKSEDWSVVCSFTPQGGGSSFL